MKKILSTLIVLMLALTVAACGTDNGAVSSQASSRPEISQTIEPSSSEAEISSEPFSEPEASEPAATTEYEIAQQHVYAHESLGGYTNAYFVAELKNTGDVPVTFQDVSIDLMDAEGSIIASKKSSVVPRVVEAGGSGYICESMLSLNQELSVEDIGEATINGKFGPGTPADLGVVITDTSLTEKTGFPNITGMAENQSDKDYGTLMLAFPIKDAEGKLLTVATGMVQGFTPGAKQGFEQMATSWDTNLDFTDATFEVIPYTLL